MSQTTHELANELDFDVLTGNWRLAGNQPANYTLIKGAVESILIDVPFARSDAHRVIAAILDSATTLTAIFITHDHPDHFFSLDLFTQTFPDVPVIAHPVVAAEIERSVPLKFDRWAQGMGTNAPRTGVAPTPYEAPQLKLESHTLQILGPMQGDHVHATAIWHPDSRTLIAGDIVFNGVHLFLGEHRPQQYQAWLESLDSLASLEPAHVIAGHSRPGLPDDSFSIDWTRRYLQHFASLAKTAHSSEELSRALVHAYPTAVGFPGSNFLLEVSTQVATGEIEPWNE